MRPLFTVHAGEYLVGTKLETTLPDLRVWIPSKDTGIDLLVTDASQRKMASLQVKFSKDFLGTSKQKAVTPEISSGGWWTSSRKKIASSPADYWVLVLHQFQSRVSDVVIIRPRELLARYDRIGASGDDIQSYFWVTKQGRCFEVRGLGKSELLKIGDGTYRERARDFTRFLNDWPFAARR